MRKSCDVELVFTDWLRSRRGEPMQHADHLAQCELCRQELARLNALQHSLQHLDLPITTEHISPEMQAAFVEQRLAGKQRETLQLHLAECTDCRQSITDLARITGLVPERGVVAQRDSSGLLRSLASFFSVRHGLSAVAGAAAMFLLMLYVFPPQQISRPVPDPSLPIVGGHKGATENDHVAALRALGAVVADSKDRQWALPIWQKAVDDLEALQEEHPQDQRIQRWLKVLRDGLQELKAAQPAPEPVSGSGQ